jgi:hypothetical protein
MREWVIYAVIMSVVFAVFFRESGLIGALSGLLVSGPLYLGLGAVLAKLGLQRKSIGQLRKERSDGTAPSGKSGKSGKSESSSDTSRPRPAPTRRTGAGQRPGSRTTRRR